MLGTDSSDEVSLVDETRNGTGIPAEDETTESDQSTGDTHCNVGALTVRVFDLGLLLEGIWIQIIPLVAVVRILRRIILKRLGIFIRTTHFFFELVFVCVL